MATTRTRKKAAATAAVDQPNPDQAPAAPESDAAADAEENVSEEPPVTPAAAVPEENVDYFAEIDFTASLDHQLLTFKAGEQLDPLAGAALLASGAPISVQPHPED